MALSRVAYQVVRTGQCCCAHIHTTPSTPSQWDDIVGKVKRTTDRYTRTAKQTWNQERVKFERIKRERTGNSKQRSSALGFLDRFPTISEFNGYFDRGLWWLPTGADLMRRAPENVKPYLQLSRVDKPIGSWLLFLPGAWGITMAASHFSIPHIPLLAAFGVGAIMMRGAGCTVNDIWDIDIDKRVARTRNRPLASNTLSKQDAINWLIIQLACSSLILFSLNKPTIAVGIASLGLVAIYPKMKLLTDYPQVVLGFTFNMGAIMGYSAYTGSIMAVTPLALYSAGICWTMVYDTVYAHQDKLDDKKVGVRSTALRFGDQTKPILSRFVNGFGWSLFIAGVAAGMGPTFYLATFMSSCMLMRGLQLVDLNRPHSCWEFFIMNKNIGLLIWLGAIIGNFL